MTCELNISTAQFLFPIVEVVEVVLVVVVRTAVQVAQVVPSNGVPSSILSFYFLSFIRSFVRTIKLFISTSITREYLISDKRLCYFR
jgi:hypothetical protein